MKTLIIMLALASSSIMAGEVGLTKEGGVYHVPVKINDQMTLKFVLDSGAGDVQIPLDVAKTLIRTGTIVESDFLESKSYTMADGSTEKQERLLIKRLQVGDEVITNVTVSISKEDGILLLGQSFLERFAGWSIDNNKQALILNGHKDAVAGDQQASVTAASTPEKPIVFWRKDNEYGMRIVASDKACDLPELVAQGYQFNIMSSIPVDRLKSPDDAYIVVDDHAFTVNGCWSPKMHKASWHRKHDGKEWVDNFKIDDTWIKIDNNQKLNAESQLQLNIGIESNVYLFVNGSYACKVLNDVTTVEDAISSLKRNYDGHFDVMYNGTVGNNIPGQVAMLVFTSGVAKGNMSYFFKGTETACNETSLEIKKQIESSK